MSVSNNTIAGYLDVDSQQIVGRRDLADSVIVLVNEGIGGIKKYTIPLTSFAVAKKQAVKDEPEQDAPATTVDYASLTVTELQEAAKERGIAYSGLRKAELVEALGGE